MSRKWWMGLLMGGALLALPLFGIRWWVGQRCPPATGSLWVRGLEAPVTLQRDAQGVQSIQATSLHDAWFAQGVIHAQERLWQMDAQRRVGRGRLSEWLGEQALESDKLARTLNLTAAAEQDWAAASPAARAALRAYSDGVNAWVATQETLPPEYRLLEATWEPWEPQHSLLWLKVFQWQGSQGWQEELLHAQMQARLGAETAAQLLPEAVPPAALPLDGPDGIGFAQLPDLALSALAGDGASAWVVGGKRTASGQPLLVAELHAGPTLPGPWYEVALQAPGLAVVGASLPGVPGILVGHNAEIGWGLAPLPSDTQDWFVERLDEATQRVEWEGGMEAVQQRQETILVRGGDALSLTVRETRHGPLMNPLLPGVARPLALRWQGSVAPSHLMDALLAVNTATSQPEFLAALEQWDSPPQAFLYADRTGLIGSVAAGKVPVRGVPNGALPQPGWTTAGEWKGAISADSSAHRWNPAEGWLLASSGVLLPAAGEASAPAAESAPLRARRLQALIESDPLLTADDAQAIQRDVDSLLAAQLVPHLVALRSDDLIVQRMQEQLASWNLQVEADLPGAGIFEVAYGFTLRGLLADDFGEEEAATRLLDAFLDSADPQPLLVRLLADPDHPLWDDQRTANRERRDDILGRALAETSEWLGRRFGDVPHEWFWGRLHTLHFQHPLGSTRALFAPWWNRRTEASGDGSTIHATGFSWASPFAATTLPGYRQIVPIGEWGEARMLLATGQSGQPGHPHYASMLDPWQQGTLAPMPWLPQQAPAGDPSLPADSATSFLPACGLSVGWP